MLTFALNYWWGGQDTFGYHVINVILHVLNALLLYAISVRLLVAVRPDQDGIAPYPTSRATSS